MLLFLVVLLRFVGADNCTDACSKSLPSACAGSCPFSLLSRTSEEDGSTAATEVMCSDTCAAAWSGPDFAKCRASMNPSDSDATAMTQTLNAMTDACDTICFLQSGTSLSVFQQQCASIFSGAACSDTCKTLVNVNIDRDCRNKLVAASNPDISSAAKAVFAACGALFDGPADCSDPCSQSQNLREACEGSCPYELFAASNTADGNITAVGILCKDTCQAAWSDQTYQSCLRNLGQDNMLSQLNTAGNQTCPASCFLDTYDKDPAGAADCNMIARNSSQDCTDKCKSLVEAMGSECRTTVASLPATSITDMAKLVFDKCGVSYGDAQSATSKLAAQGVIITGVLAIVLSGLLLRHTS